MMKLILFNALIIVFTCCTYASSFSARTIFSIKRGINLNSWLEVKNLDSLKLTSAVSTSSIDNLLLMGIDHVRIPVNEANLLNEDLSLKKNVCDVLTNLIDYCIAHGIKVIVDLHETRVHHFGRNDEPLFREQLAKEHFFLVWQKLQGLLAHYHVDVLAYECLNEPAASKKNHDEWNELLSEWILFIRKNEPERILFIGSNRGNQLWTFKYLKIPKNDLNLVLTFHFYKPKALTHYKASWSSTKDYDGPIDYPGQTIPLKNFNILPDSLQQKYKYATKWFDINEVRQEIKKAIEIAEKYDLPLNVGEFGCRRPLPDSTRYAWFKDVVSVFDEYKISYTLWGLNGAGFGLYDGSGSLDTTMMKIIFAKKG